MGDYPWDSILTMQVSVHSGLQKGTGEFNAGVESYNGLASHPGGSRSTPYLQKPEKCLANAYRKAGLFHTSSLIL